MGHLWRSALLTNCVYVITCTVTRFPPVKSEWNKHSVHASLSPLPITALSRKIVFAQIVSCLSEYLPPSFGFPPAVHNGLTPSPLVGTSACSCYINMTSVSRTFFIVHWPVIEVQWPPSGDIFCCWALKSEHLGLHWEKRDSHAQTHRLIVISPQASSLWKNLRPVSNQLRFARSFEFTVNLTLQWWRGTHSFKLASAQ